jgi:sortase A
MAPTRIARRRRRLVRRRTGICLVAVGLAMLGVVAYQLWGTGLATARAQAGFRAQIRAHGFPARPIPGGAIGFIRIPRIHLDMAFVEGIGPTALAEGPGHYRQTPLPGEGGNVAIAGHRTTYLHPFWALNRLEPGDRVTLQTRAGTFVYRVVWQRTLPSGSWWVIGPTRAPSLTLTTCNPRFLATQRLVVRAVQIAGPSTAVTAS